MSSFIFGSKARARPSGAWGRLHPQILEQAGKACQVTNTLAYLAAFISARKFDNIDVRLRTHVGKPVYPSDYDDVEALRAATVEAVEKLIEQNQRIPGSVSRAVGERLELVSTLMDLFFSSSKIQKQNKLERLFLESFFNLGPIQGILKGEVSLYH
jgi:hypothetical protein